MYLDCERLESELTLSSASSWEAFHDGPVMLSDVIVGCEFGVVGRLFWIKPAETLLRSLKSFKGLENDWYYVQELSRSYLELSI